MAPVSAAGASSWRQAPTWCSIAAPVVSTWSCRSGVRLLCGVCAGRIEASGEAAVSLNCTRFFPIPFAATAQVHMAALAMLLPCCACTMLEGSSAGSQLVCRKISRADRSRQRTKHIHQAAQAIQCGRGITLCRVDNKPPHPAPCVASGPKHPCHCFGPISHTAPAVGHTQSSQGDAVLGCTRHRRCVGWSSDLPAAAAAGGGASSSRSAPGGGSSVLAPALGTPPHYLAAGNPAAPAASHRLGGRGSSTF